MAFQKNGPKIRETLESQLEKKRMRQPTSDKRKINRVADTQNIRVFNETHERIVFIAKTLKKGRPIYKLIDEMLEIYVEKGLSPKERKLYASLFGDNDDQ